MNLLTKNSVFRSTKQLYYCTVLIALAITRISNGQELIWGYFNYPPVIYFDQKEQKAKGLALGIVKQIEAQTKLKFKLKHYPMPRILEAIKNGVPIVLSNPKWPTLERLGTFSSKPIFTVKTAIMSDNALPKDLKNMNGILGLIRGYNYSGSLLAIKKHNPLLKVTLRNSHLSLLKSLKVGRINYALDYLAPAQTASYQLDYRSLHHRVISELPVLFFVSNNVDKKHQLINMVENIIPSLRYQKSPWADSQGLLQEN